MMAAKIPAASFAQYLIKHLLPMLLMFFGGLGTLYTMGTGAGGKPGIAGSLLILAAGIVLTAADRIAGTEFFERNFGEMLRKRRNKKGKKIGKKCPKCSKVIYHKRTVCQHCGFEFPSKKYKDEQQKLKEEIAKSETVAAKNESEHH